ncbi:hypothetical protein EDF46_0866 [Frondihabitans sp. PhB188]|nr:hypothetical protein EDF46_0866 [Frondihabitans sp. PhB188]
MVEFFWIFIGAVVVLGGGMTVASFIALHDQN